MQEYKGEKLLKTESGELKDLMAVEMEKQATHRVIGRFPARGSVVTINGLQFVVKSFSIKLGTLHLEIRKPENRT